MQTQTNTNTWAATYRSGKLTVTGHLTFATTGYSVKLKKANSAIAHPGTLLLDKIVTNPTGIVADHVVSEVVTWEEHTESKYQAVEILPDGIRIPVESNFARGQ
jgi:hypothetical protein